MPTSKPAKRTSRSSGKSTSRSTAKKTTTSKASKSSRTSSSRRSGGNTSGTITNYTSALRWLFNHTDYERMRFISYNNKTFNLDRMRKLLKLLGNPDKDLMAVHIAGTKGKGSTCAMLDSMLRANGLTVGLYTSPHLVDLRERIQINSEMISTQQMTDLLKYIKNRYSKMGSDKPTFFEIMTAAALRYFSEQAVDIAVLETGLGGRLDSTNVVKPLVCGITNISYDHMAVLGKTLDKIAREKAGIFKPDVPAYSVPQDPEAEAALREVAQQTGTPLKITGQDIEFSYRFEANRELGPHTRVCLTTPRFQFEHLAVPLQGEHQSSNCGLALAIMDELSNKGFNIKETKVVEGLAATQLPGRMELAWQEPRILLDGAHNAASMSALFRAIGAHIPYDSSVVIFGTSSDKDISGMLREVNLGADKVIFTRARSNPRALEVSELAAKFNELSDHKMAQTAENLEEALNLAARAVTREDLICITGSFHLVGEAKKHLANLADKRQRAQAG